jgi:DNA-binding transcriptional LysR family regulator
MTFSRKVSLLQLRQLEYIAAIMRYKTMRKAARELYISEATISQQIRLLETELGFSFFQRENSGLRLSAEGEKLLPDLQLFLRAKQEFDQKIAAVKKSHPTQIRLGLSPYVAIIFAQTIYQKFHKLYPEIVLDISEGTTYTLAEHVQTHQKDLAVLVLSNHLPVPWDDLMLKPLCSTEGVMLASPHHPLAHKERISKAQLARAITITYAENRIIGDLLTAVFGEEGIETRKVISSIANVDTFFSLVREGLGVMLCSKNIVGMEPMATRLRDLRILDLSPDIHFPLSHACAYPRQQYLSDPMKTLIAIIHQCYAQLPTRM